MIQSSNSESNLPSEGDNIANSAPKKVILRRKKTSAKNSSTRASFPQIHYSVDKIMSLSLSSEVDFMNNSTDKLEGKSNGAKVIFVLFNYFCFIWNGICFLEDRESSCGSRIDLNKISDIPIPEWVVLGESVLIRPYNSSGVIAYIGGTEFATGTWIGVELDAPKGITFGNVFF